MRYFMETPEDRFFEHLMQEPPRLRPYQPKPEFVEKDCRYCLYYKGKQVGCVAHTCCLPLEDRPDKPLPMKKGG